MRFKDRVKAGRIFRSEPFHVERFDQQVYLRELSGGQRDRVTNLYLRAQASTGKVGVMQDLPDHINEVIIVMGCYDDEACTQRSFEDKDVDWLADELPGEVREQIAARIQEISGMTPAAEDDAAKNSAAGQTSDSGSGSHATLDSL